MASYSELVQKKVAGIPVLYLAGGFVLILAVVAYRMKNVNSTAVTATDAKATGVDVNGNAVDEADPYTGLATHGTVVVQPQAPASQDAAKQTNEAWLRSAVADVVAGNIATAGDAQAALTKYLGGDDLTFEEGKIRDYAIQKDGLPPEPLVQIGQVSTAPAQKQFSLYPGIHVVKGNNDNTAAKLAQLYYGTADANHVNEIIAHNFHLGPAGTTYNVGTKINIPEFRSPRYFTVVKGYQYPSEIGKKNGIPLEFVYGYNPGMVFPVAIGTKVRVE